MTKSDTAEVIALLILSGFKKNHENTNVVVYVKGNLPHVHIYISRYFSKVAIGTIIKEPYHNIFTVGDFAREIAEL